MPDDLTELEDLAYSLSLDAAVDSLRRPGGASHREPVPGESAQMRTAREAYADALDRASAAQAEYARATRRHLDELQAH